jgi:hypothetical protein
MDVVGGESSGVSGQLLLLYPLLFSLQVRVGVRVRGVGAPQGGQGWGAGPTWAPRTLLGPARLHPQFFQFAIGLGVALRTYGAWMTPDGWLEDEAQVGQLRGW